MDKMENLCRILRQYGIPDEMEGRTYLLRAVEIMNTQGLMGPGLRLALAHDFGRERGDIAHALYLVRRRMMRRGWTSYPLPHSSAPLNMLLFLQALNKQSEL